MMRVREPSGAGWAARTSRGVALAAAVAFGACASPADRAPTPPPPTSPPATAPAPTGPGATGSPAATPPAELSWEELASAPTARTEVSAAVDGDGRIVVVGGFAEGQDTVATVEVYDPREERWTAGPDLPLAVNHAMAAAVDGTVHVVGGYRGPGLAQPTDRGFALRDGRWQELPAMPEPRAAGGAAAVDGALYVVAGVGPAGLARQMLVLEDGTWRTEPGPSAPREHLGVAAAGGAVYAVGGRTAGMDTNVADAEVFDPDRGAWERLPDLPTARGGLGASATDPVGAAAPDGYVVAVGGEQPAGTFADVEALDLEAGRWVPLPPLPTPRHGLGVAAVGPVLYAIAGGPEPGYAFSAANEALDLRGDAGR